MSLTRLYANKTLDCTTASCHVDLQVVVGKEREASNITMNGTTISAMPGQDGAYDNRTDKCTGGDGFSGGGGYCQESHCWGSGVTILHTLKSVQEPP